MKHTITIICDPAELVKYDFTGVDSNIKHHVNDTVRYIQEESPEYMGLEMFIGPESIRGIYIDDCKTPIDYPFDNEKDMEEEIDPEGVYGIFQELKVAFAAELEVDNFESNRLYVNELQEIKYYIGSDSNILKEINYCGAFDPLYGENIPETDIITAPMDYISCKDRYLSKVITNGKIIEVNK